MFDHRHVKLGKAPAKQNRKVPLLKTYMEALPAAPNAIDYLHGRTTFPMLLNDKLGCCTAASKAHGLSLQVGAGRNRTWDASDKDVLAFYEASTGYDPTNPETDQGGVMLNVLTYMLHNGFAGWRIQGFGLIGLGDIENLFKAVWLLGFADVGIGLPITAQNAKLWDVPRGGLQGDGAPNSWGGHDALIVKYDRNAGRVWFLTWTGLQEATVDFVHAYVDEMYGWKSRAFIGSDGKAPNGFLDAQLDADMRALG